MTAADAPQPKIHAGTQYEHLLCAARVFFLHCQYIVDLYVHRKASFRQIPDNLCYYTTFFDKRQHILRVFFGFVE